MKFDTNFLLSTLLLIISQKYYANLVEAGKVVNFLLEGEDGGQFVLMKATIQKKLQQSNDNEIYRVTPLEWLHMQRNSEMTIKNDVVVKIVHLWTQEGYSRKEFEMLTHEVDMLWLAKANACQHVVQLFEAQIVKNTVYMVMEMGTLTLEKRIQNFAEKWVKTTITAEGKNEMMEEIHKIIMDIAKALADFHRIGIHFSLKPENWLYFDDQLKLIDLQTALAVDSNGIALDPIKNWNYICRPPNEKKYKKIYSEPYGKFYSSPEYINFCRKFKIDNESGKVQVESNGLISISTKADIWSFGLVICQILLATPQIKAKKLRDEWKSIGNKNLNFFEILSIVFSEMEDEFIVENEKKEAENVAKDFLSIVEGEFPHIHVLLKSTFLLNPEDRPTADQIQKYLLNTAKIYKKKWPAGKNEEAEKILFENIKKNKVGNVEWAKNAKFDIVKGAGKVVQFLLEGEDGGQFVLMKADIQKKLQQSKDNEIYRVTPLEWPHMQRNNELTMKDDVVVKIVHLTTEDGYIRKEFNMLTHEVDMLWLAKAKACQSVVELFDAQIAQKTVYMAMEFGPQTLENVIREFGRKWIKKEGKSTMMMDIHTTIMDMAKALADFHRIGIHLALKPGNFLRFNDRLKLIDLQTALPVDGNGKALDIQKNWIYSCRSPNEEKYKTKNFETYCKTYASPEHRKFCTKIKKDSDGVKIDMENVLSTKADIWSFGLVICQILLATPQIQAKKLRNEWKSKRNNKMRNLLEILSLVFSEMGDQFTDKNQKKEAKKVAEEFLTIVKEEFPHIYVLLKSIFLLKPKERSTADQIQNYLENVSKFHENGGKWPEKVDAQSILEENIHINVVGSVEWAKNAKFVIEEEKRGAKRMRDEDGIELKPNKGQNSIHRRYISHNMSGRTP